MTRKFNKQHTNSSDILKPKGPYHFDSDNHWQDLRCA